MQIGRRALGLTAAAAVLARSGAARAQAFPTRPIRIIVPSGPGGSLDILARAIAQAVTEQSGWPMVVENRAGGGSVIGFDALAKSRPDGYTLLIGSDPLVLNPSLFPSLPYDTLRDIAPLTMVATLSQVLAVGPRSPFRSFEDFVAAARSGRTLNIGNSGSTSPGRLAAELMGLAGAKVTSITYRSGGAAVADVVAGVLDGTIVTLPATLPFLNSGDLRALAVTSPRRSPFRPDVPTMAETLPEAVLESWQALFVPAGMAPDLRAELHAKITAAIRSPKLDAFLRDQAFEPVAGPPEELDRFVRAELPKWRSVVQQTGMKPD